MMLLWLQCALSWFCLHRFLLQGSSNSSLAIGFLCTNGDGYTGLKVLRAWPTGKDNPWESSDRFFYPRWQRLPQHGLRVQTWLV